MQNLALPVLDTDVHEGRAESKLCFGGVEFQFRGEPRLLRILERAGQLRHASVTAEARGKQARPFARLCCELRGPRALPPAPYLGPETRQVSYTWQNGVGHAKAWGVSAHLNTTTAAWTAQVELWPGHRAAQNLLNLLAYALVDRASGAVLHAASVDVGAGVVAFVGPSGAGKSTACSHADGALFFTADRLAVVSAPLATGWPRWTAHALPGGTPLREALPESPALGRPLRAVLRIRQTPSGCWFERCSRSNAVALLLESSFHATPAAAQLARLERLADEVPVGNLYFSLGTPLGTLLEQWLNDGTLGEEPRNLEQEHGHRQLA